MRRLFPILTTVVGLMLMGAYFSGLMGRPDDLGRGVRLAAAVATLSIHASAFVYLQATGRRVEATARRLALPEEATARRLALPEWVGAQAEKNRRKALVYEIPGSVMAIVGTGFVVGEWWHPLRDGVSVSFQFSAFLAEYMIIANQSRLLGDLDARKGSTGPAGEP